MRILPIVILFVFTSSIIARPMPWRSKGELLATGFVTDSTGYRYNVLIVPGYAKSLEIFTSQYKRGAQHQFHGLKTVGIGLKDIPH